MMKATVYYDVNGIIQSVMYLDPDGGAKPYNPDYASLEIELDDKKPNGLLEIHSKYQVDTVRCKLIRRSSVPRQPNRE